MGFKTDSQRSILGALTGEPPPRRYFGTDGIRGPLDSPLLAEMFVRRLGRALGRHLADRSGHRPRHVVLGQDTRASGAVLGRWLVEGLAAQGVHIYNIGVVPTPAVAMAVRDLQADLGIVLTASHNPASDNGIKLFGPDGYKLDDETELALEARIDAEPAPVGGAADPFPYDGAGFYRNVMRSILHEGSLGGWRIVVDAANGATVNTTPAVLRELGAEVDVLGGAPNGTNINAGVGSEYPEVMCARVREIGADLGIAHDGDGDRLVVCDQHGDLVDGDELLAMVGLHALREGRLEHRTLVATVMSNLGLDLAIEAAGGKVVRTAVGDRYVIHEMRRHGYTMGGENSGHLVFADVSTTGDGLLAALKVMRVLLKTRQGMAQARQVLTLFPQRRRNLRIAERIPFSDCPGLQDRLNQIENGLGRGRLLVRYSGTEALLRVMVEAEAAALADQGLAAVEEALRAALPVQP